MMRVQILTLSGIKFDGEADELALTTVTGDIAVLTDHEPMSTIVKPGAVHVRSGKHEDTFVTFGGILDIDGKEARLLSDEVEHADDLIEHEIEAALASAQQLLEDAKDKKALHHAQTLVDRHGIRLNVAQLRRRRRH